MQPLPTDWPRRVAILGVGLLGGSVGLSLRRKLPNVEIVGTSRDAGRRQSAIDSGAVDRAVASPDEACQECDVVVLAAPVDRIAAMAVGAASATPQDCLITDVGSTKRGIVAALAEQPQTLEKFVAAHPIAGSEKTGVENATATLFDGRLVILTPTDQTDPEKRLMAERFWALTGGEVVAMPPDVHDTHLAAVSHVPHLMSALVARMAPAEARRLVGSGWRDITRVAAGDPTLWTAITAENRGPISAELGRMAEDLQRLRDLIASEDDAALLDWLAEAKTIKEAT